MSYSFNNSQGFLLGFIFQSSSQGYKICATLLSVTEVWAEVEDKCI